MIKFIIFCTKILIAAIVALLFSSCNQVFNGIKGDGNVQIEQRKVDEKFTKISVNKGLEVIIEQADVVEIEVEADQNLLSHIKTNVENGTLIISSDANIYSAEKEIVRVKMPTIESLETTSGSNLTSKGILIGTSLALKSSSGSEIDITAEFEKINSESTSGSTILVSGKALELSTASSSGSQINAEKLLVNEVTSQSTSGSSTSVHPIVSLKAKASSGSSIGYDGTPQKIEKEETSGGSVSKI